MKILLDPYIFHVQRFGGISRLFNEFYRKANQHKELAVSLPLLYSENLHLENGNKWFGRYYKWDTFIFRYIKLRVYQFNLYLICLKLRFGRFQVFIPTYYNNYFLPYLGDTKLVLVVYDMIHEIYPENFNLSDTTASDKKELLFKADKIIAISHNTKLDILKFHPNLDPDKIAVVYLNHSITLNNQVNGVISSKVEPGKYLLFTGNRNGYKNFKWVIVNLSNWLISNKIQLVCLGGGAFNESEKILIRSFNLDLMVNQFDVKDFELKSYYFNAFAFIFPSLYEGFGIPILEAMSCNCPVFLPEISSFPEVAGDAGLYFSLNDPDSLFEKLNKLLLDNSFRCEIIDKSITQLKKFSWDKMTNEFIEVCYDAIAK